MGNGFTDWFERSAKYIVIVLLAIAAATLVVLAQQNVRANANSNLQAGPIPTFSSPPEPMLAVIGDSYTAGADNPMMWPSKVAAKYGYKVKNVAVGGTGYSGTAGTFGDQLSAAVAAKPTVLIIAGGRNDALRASEVRVSAADLLSKAKQQLPGTRIIVIGPMWDSTAPISGVEDVNDAVQKAAAGANVEFHDALSENWLHDPNWIRDDKVHPNDEGEAQLAEHIGSIVAKSTR
jgi:lysophospholipase L1-like esterase